MKKSVILLHLLLCSLHLFSQSFDTAKMDSLFSEIEENGKGMGSISIYEDGKEVYQNSIGHADINKGMPATANTKYRIGSISKTFTAAIMMQLIEENKLKLSSKLAEFYPEIPNSKEITIEQLLRHRSGLQNFTYSDEYFT